MTGGRREPAILLLVAALALVASGIRPRDRLTWWLEVAPVLVAIPLLVVTHRRFPLTPLAYRLILLHALVLVLGARYTYALVPAGLWIQDWLGLARNHYDRFAHFVQGFVPAILAREVLLRTTPLRSGGWLFFVVLSIALAVSAAYEIGEFLAAKVGGEAADAFLGTQGDHWDTQWDMTLALLGAVTAQLALSRIHDQELAALGRPAPV
jgi:putative membrane protein